MVRSISPTVSRLARGAAGPRVRPRRPAGLAVLSRKERQWQDHYHARYCPPSPRGSSPPSRRRAVSPAPSTAMPPAPAPRIRPGRPRGEKGTVPAMTEPGSAATMCQAFQQTAARYPDAMEEVTGSNPVRPTRSQRCGPRNTRLPAPRFCRAGGMNEAVTERVAGPSPAAQITTSGGLLGVAELSAKPA